jgi:putative acetyltransferase
MEIREEHPEDKPGIHTVNERAFGQPKYYPRFGFEPASRHDIRSQWSGVPNDAFMVLILDELAMHGKTGVVRYRSEFDEVM